MRGETLLRNLGNTIQPLFKKHGSVILTSVSAVGVVATAVLAAKETPKAMERLEVAKKEKGEELTKFEKVKVATPAYIPAIAMGTATIACIVGNHVYNEKKQAALIAAYTALDTSFKEYKEKVEEVHGEGADNEIKEAVARGKYEHVKEEVQNDKPDGKDVYLFFDEYSNRYFWKSFNEVEDAMYHFNRNFALRGYADLNELYEFLQIGPTAYGAEVGWSIGASDAFYGYSWIDYYIKEHHSDDPDNPTYYTIVLPFSPTADFMDY